MKHLFNALKEHWQIYLGLFLGLIIGLLVGVGFTDWKSLVKGFDSKVTDWIMALCTIGILIGTLSAAIYAKKSAAYSRLQLYLDKNTLNNIEVDLILKLKVLLDFIDRTPDLSALIQKKRKINNALRIFKERHRENNVTNNISIIQSTIKLNPVLIKSVLNTDIFKLDTTVEHIKWCALNIIIYSKQLDDNCDTSDQLLESIDTAYKHLLECKPYISESILSIESNLRI